MIKLTNKKNAKSIKIPDAWCTFIYDKINITLPKECNCGDPECIKYLIDDFDKIKENDWYLTDSNNNILNLNNRNIISEEEMEKWKRLKNYNEIKDDTFFTTRKDSFDGSISYSFTISSLSGSVLDNTLTKTNNIIINRRDIKIDGILKE